MAEIRADVYRIAKLGTVPRSSLELADAEHRAIVRAIAAGKAKAAREAMVRHVESTRALWLGLGVPPPRPRRTADEGGRRGARGIDIASHEAYADGIPHDRFALLREHDPVHWHPWEWETGGFWAITKYDDVVAVSKDSRTFSSAVGHINLWDLEEDAREARRSMLETDPPEHTRLRRIVSSAFTPRQVREYERPTREITLGLLDAAPAAGEVDWVAAVSAPLPINVFVSILGIPDEDAAFMVELSDALVAGTSAEPPDPHAYGNTTPLRLLPFQSPAAHAMFEYGRRIGEERRRSPTDDLVSRLVHAEVDGDRLTDQEYCNFFQVLVFAGTRRREPRCRTRSSSLARTRTSSSGCTPIRRSSRARSRRSSATQAR